MCCEFVVGTLDAKSGMLGASFIIPVHATTPPGGSTKKTQCVRKLSETGTLQG